MGDSYSDPQHSGKQMENNRGNFRGGRGSGNRDGGGFRIRLSDNEMRAAHCIQDAFQLKSVVAVLGFALRTLAQLVEEGALDDLINSHRNQSSSSRREHQGGSDRNGGYSQKESPKANPFARPAKPQKTEPEASSNAEEPQGQVPNPTEPETKEAESNNNASNNVSFETQGDLLITKGLNLMA